MPSRLPTPSAKKCSLRPNVSVVKLYEGTSLTRSEWSSQLGVSVSTVEYLINARILRPGNGDRLELALVGIVVFNDSLLFAAPKFVGGKSFDLPEILRILRDYFARSAFRRPVVDRMHDPEYGNSEALREYDALQRMQEWFFTHGLYRREQAQASDLGRPHWVKTIAKCSPILIQGAAIYPHMIAERREGILNDVSALQISILRRLLDRYGMATPSVVEHSEKATGSIVSQWPIPDNQRTYLDRRLALEQRSVYRTDSLQLLRLLRELLGSRLAGVTSQPQIYGTTAFYSVWEDACRVAIGTEGQIDPASSLGQPVWWSQNNMREKTRYDQEQIPDIVVVRRGWNVIIDAKYYYRFPASRPGGPDIVKQLYYMEALRTPGANVLSVFLVPFPGEERPKFLGYSTIEGAHRSFPKIEAWGIDPGQLFANYPAASAHGADDLIDFILSQRDSVAEFVSQAPTHIGGQRS